MRMQQSDKKMLVFEYEFSFEVLFVLSASKRPWAAQNQVAGAHFWHCQNAITASPLWPYVIW